MYDQSTINQRQTHRQVAAPRPVSTPGARSGAHKAAASLQDSMRACARPSLTHAACSKHFGHSVSEQAIHLVAALQLDVLQGTNNKGTTRSATHFLDVPCCCCPHCRCSSHRRWYASQRPRRLHPPYTERRLDTGVVSKQQLML